MFFFPLGYSLRRLANVKHIDATPDRRLNVERVSSSTAALSVTFYPLQHNTVMLTNIDASNPPLQRQLGCTNGNKGLVKYYVPGYLPSGAGYRVKCVTGRCL